MRTHRHAISLADAIERLDDCLSDEDVPTADGIPVGVLECLTLSLKAASIVLSFAPDELTVRAMIEKQVLYFLLHQAKRGDLSVREEVLRQIRETENYSVLDGSCTELSEQLLEASEKLEQLIHSAPRRAVQAPGPEWDGYAANRNVKLYY